VISRSKFFGKGVENDGVQGEKNQLEDHKSSIGELPTKEAKDFSFHTQFSQKLVVPSFCLFVERKFCILSHFCERNEGDRDDVSILDGNRSHYTPQLGGMAAQTFSLANIFKS
jgi:hypothetical protein